MEINEVINLLNKKITKDNLVAVYRVGLVDNSQFSDWDLVVVLNNKVSHAKGIDSRLDVRFLGDIQEFRETYDLLPYAQLQLVYGKELLTEQQRERDDRKDLVKICSLFFTSFLRNYYSLRQKPQLTTREVLVNLNDFFYCKLYLKEIPDPIKEFLDKIEVCRTSPHNFDLSELLSLLDEAIDHAWNLVEMLNTILKKEFVVKYPNEYFLNKEPTIFVSATAMACRKLTEDNLSLNGRIKLIYLPLGFQYIFADDDFARAYVKRNLTFAYDGVLPFIKRAIKKLYCIYRYFEYHNFKTNSLDKETL